MVKHRALDDDAHVNGEQLLRFSACPCAHVRTAQVGVHNLDTEVRRVVRVVPTNLLRVGCIQDDT